MLPRRIRMRRRDRRGASLVEFALVSLVLYLLLAATIEMGRMLHASQTVQAAADLLARELSRTPLPPDITLAEALDDPTVRETIFDKHYLVIPEGMDTSHLPVVNQQLVPLMIYSRVGGQDFLRFPGALIVDSNSSDDPLDATGYLVQVPVVEGRDADGVETIRWVDVVEPIVSDDDPEADPFSLASEPYHGIVGVRINYPFQAATLASFRANSAGPFEPNIGNPNIADDASVTQTNSPEGTPVAPDSLQPGTYAGPYGGEFGLGELGAMNSPQLANGFPLRPYRRVVSGQAVYRREIFGP
jgi:hypothetical protein